MVSTANVVNTFSDLLGQLSEKEAYVIAQRVGVNGFRQTLQQIGDHYSITRERVRQIEDKGIKEIGGRIKDTSLADIQVLASRLLHDNGGLMGRDLLVSAIIKELHLNASINQNILEVILQSDFDMQKSKPRLNTVTYFYEPQITKKNIEAIHEDAIRILKKKKDVMEQSALYTKIMENLDYTFPDTTTGLIDSVMDVFLDVVKGEEIMIGLESWNILNPKTLKDKAISVFKKGNKPLHFMDLANAISDQFSAPVKVNTVHNELIRNAEFVLIGRGIYALKSWGYKTGTVQDVLVDIFGKANNPMSSDEITEEVLKVRHVKANTIYMNLQNKKVFERVGRNLYKLK